MGNPLLPLAGSAVTISAPGEYFWICEGKPLSKVKSEKYSAFSNHTGPSYNPGASRVPAVAAIRSAVSAPLGAAPGLAGHVQVRSRGSSSFAAPASGVAGLGFPWLDLPGTVLAILLYCV